MTCEERAVFDEIAARVHATRSARQVEHLALTDQEAWVSALILEAVLYGVPMFLSSPGWLPVFSPGATAAIVHNDPERLVPGPYAG